MSATRSDKHTLTTREVMKIFEDAGIPRAQRSIERYCQQGDLDCMPDAIEKRQYITRESVETLIGQLKEIASRHPKANADQQGVATGDDNQRRAATSTDNTGMKHRPPEKQGEKQQAGEQELEALKARLKEMEDKNFNLEIDKRAKEQVISMIRDQMTQQVKDFSAELTQTSRRVGQLETEMRQLMAPRDDRRPTRDDSDARDVGGPIDVEIIEPSRADERELDNV
jgi:hypothetical protein